MRLRLGIIGVASDWSQRHLPALRILQDRFEVRGVYNSVTSFAENMAREFRTTSFDSFREMLRSEEIDAALMLESDWYGTTPIHAACDFGKAVYCGREIDFAPERAVELKQMVDQAGIAFMAEFPRRYAPATLRLKELIATSLGEPRILFCHRRLADDVQHKSRNGRSKAARGDRELLELVDWCSFIVGRSIRSIQGIRHENPETGRTDYQVLSLDLSADNAQAGTTIAQVSCGAYIPAAWHEAVNFRPPAAIQVCCENGLAFLDLPNSLIWFDEAGRHQESLDAEISVGQQLLTQFHRAVTSLVRKTGDLEDVCRGLSALRIARESCQKGIALPV